MDAAACGRALLAWRAASAPTIDPAGVWMLHAGDTTLMLFEIIRTPGGWTGAWSQPAHEAQRQEWAWTFGAPKP